MKLKFGKSVIGTKKSFLIAEIGSNHNQSLKIAKESIEVAKECGADAVKFQSINLKELYKNPSITTQKLHNIIDLDESWHQHLSNHCKKNKINFLSTPTYLKAITILSKINVNNSNISIASKDNSIVNAKYVQSNSVKYPYVSYKKKNEYGGGKLIISDFSSTNYFNEFVKDEESIIINLDTKSNVQYNKKYKKIINEIIN